MQNPNHSSADDKFSMNFGNFDTEALFNAAHMGGINLGGCKRSAHEARLDGDLGISSEEDSKFEPQRKEVRMHAHSSKEGHHHHQNNVDPKNLPVLLPNGKKTKGRVKIKMEFIDNKLRRYTTFSKRKTGIMKKAYELSTLTGTQVMLLVASETGHVYTFATRKLQPMITSEAGKALIQTCLNSPDPPVVSSSGHQLDQRMSATGYEETELTYAVADEEHKVDEMGDEYMNGSSYSGSESSSPPTPSLSPAHTPISSITNSSFSSSNGIHHVGLPLHLGQGLVITPSNAETKHDLECSSPVVLQVNCTSSLPTKNIPLESSAACLVANNLGVTDSLAINEADGIKNSITINTSNAILSGGNMRMGSSGGVMFPPSGNIVYTSPSHEGGSPLLLNLPSGLQLSQEHDKSGRLVSMNLGSSSSNQSLPTDLSLHIKRESNS